MTAEQTAILMRGIGFVTEEFSHEILTRSMQIQQMEAKLKAGEVQRSALEKRIADLEAELHDGKSIKKMPQPAEIKK